MHKTTCFVANQGIGSRQKTKRPFFVLFERLPNSAIVNSSVAFSALSVTDRFVIQSQVFAFLSLSILTTISIKKKH